MRINRIAFIVALVALCAPSVAIAGNNSLEDVAAAVADALATNDAVILKRHTLTYEEGCGISDKLKRITPKEYEREREATIAEMWHEVREATIIVDHVEIENVVLKSVDGAAPPKHFVIAVVMPVLVHEKQEIRSPMMRLFFIQIGEQWKYSFKQ